MNLREAKRELEEHGYQIHKMNECSGSGCYSFPSHWSNNPKDSNYHGNWDVDKKKFVDRNGREYSEDDFIDRSNYSHSDISSTNIKSNKDAETRKAYNDYIKDKKPNTNKLKNLVHELLANNVPENKLKIQANYQTTDPTVVAYIKCDSGTNLRLKFNKEVKVISMRYGQNTYEEELKNLFINGDYKLVKDIINFIGVEE